MWGQLPKPALSEAEGAKARYQCGTSKYESVENIC